MAQMPNENAIHTTVRAIADGTMRMADLYGHFGTKKAALEYYARHVQTLVDKGGEHAFCQSCSNQPASVVLNYPAKAVTNHNLVENVLRITVAAPLALVSRTLVKLFFGNDMVNVECVTFMCAHNACQSCNTKLQFRQFASQLVQILSWGLLLISGFGFVGGAIGASFTYGLWSEFLGFLALSGVSALVFSFSLYTIRILCPKILAPRHVRRLAPSPFRLG